MTQATQDNPLTQPDSGWRKKALIVGAVVGAVTGAGAAYMLLRNSDKDNPPTFTAMEGVKLGLLVLGLLRSVSQLTE